MALLIGGIVIISEEGAIGNPLPAQRQPVGDLPMGIKTTLSRLAPAGPAPRRPITGSREVIAIAPE
jgi:hypothetical protein